MSSLGTSVLVKLGLIYPTNSPSVPCLLSPVPFPQSLRAILDQYKIDL